MAKFFTTPSDLLNWVKTQNHTAAEAADKIASVIGSNDHQQDIAEASRRIFAGAHADHAAQVIFNILSRYDVTEAAVKTASKKVGEVYAANELLKSNLITADQHLSMVKEAQMSREPGQMQFGMRVCPKLPMSVASRRVSQYTCVHYCTASMVLDDEPERVYCMETLWRKHVMDKFNRDVKDQKTGQLVGGYIANRFYSFPDAGTPANPNAPRDGGNPMELIPGERARQPKPHEYSIERRMQEQREKGSTKSVMVGLGVRTFGFHGALMKQAEAVGLTKLSADEMVNPPRPEVAAVFSEAVDLHVAGISAVEASVKLAQTHNMRVEDVVKIQEFAVRKFSQHQADVYVVKTAQAAINTMGDPSMLEQVQHGGSFTPNNPQGLDVVVDGQRQNIPAGTVLKQDSRNPNLYFTPDEKPVQLTRDQTQQLNPVEVPGQQQPQEQPADPRDAAMLFDGQQQPAEQASVTENAAPAAATPGQL